MIQASKGHADRACVGMHDFKSAEVRQHVTIRVHRRQNTF